MTEMGYAQRNQDHRDQKDVPMNLKPSLIKTNACKLQRSQRAVGISLGEAAFKSNTPSSP